MENRPAYGTTRERQANVSYLEIERAALGVLESGQRPSVEIIRKRLGRGSPATIAAALKRFWRDLGIRAAGDPASLSRMPSEVVDVADGLWQKALALASQAAKQEDNGARQRLQQLQLENEVRAQYFAAREKELDVTARAREQALADARTQIAALMKELAIDRETMRAQVARIIALSEQVEGCRQQLAGVVSRAVAQHRVHVGGQPQKKSRVRLRAKAKRKAAASKLSGAARKPALKSRRSK
jgi:hypothetical protein